MATRMRSITWRVNGAAVGTGASLVNDVFVGGDTVTCTVVAIDGVGDTGNTDTASITINNTAPTIGNVTISPSNPYTDDELTCTRYTYNDVDGDNDASGVMWVASATQGGSGTTIGVGTTLSASMFKRDEWISCVVTASDGSVNGNAGTDEVFIQNSAPVIANASITPASPSASTPALACNYAYSDADNDPTSPTSSGT